MPTPSAPRRRSPAGLFGHPVGQARRGLRRKLGEAVRLSASTGVNLSGLSADWARLAARTCGAEARIVYDPDADGPLYLAVTAARANAITAAKAMPIEPGATYAFDLAATTPTAGGPGSTPPAAGSSRACSATRRST